jgi:hypothetical protein
MFFRVPIWLLQAYSSEILTELTQKKKLKYEAHKTQEKQGKKDFFSKKCIISKKIITFA